MKKTNFEETKILKKKLKKAQNLEIILLFPCAESRCELVISRTGHLQDWSSPDDPVRVLAAVGLLNPSTS